MVSDTAKRQLAMVLVATALLFGIGAAAAWNVGEGKDPNPYNTAFGLPPDPPKKDSDHVLSFILLGGTAVALISAAILGASAKPPEPGETKPLGGDEDGGWG